MIQEQESGGSAIQLLADCRARLEQLNRVIQQRSWQKATALAVEYSQTLQQLDRFAGDAALIPELVQLDIRHRRVMRQLSQQIAAVNDDIRNLDAGSKSGRRSCAWLSANMRH
jgi:hypothetical protein